MSPAAGWQDESRPFVAADSDEERALEKVDAGAEDRSVHALLRRQAAHLIDCTLHAELEILLARHASITDAQGRPAYVRNGYQPPRDLVTNLGPVTIRIPKVRSRIDRPVVFRSALARPYLRRTRSVMLLPPRPMATMPDWASSLMPNGSRALRKASTLPRSPVTSTTRASVA